MAEGGGEAGELAFDEEAAALVLNAARLGPAYEKSRSPSRHAKVLVSFPTLVAALSRGPSPISAWFQRELPKEASVVVELSSLVASELERGFIPEAVLALADETWDPSARAIAFAARDNAARERRMRIGVRDLVNAALDIPDLEAQFAELGLNQRVARQSFDQFLEGEAPAAAKNPGSTESQSAVQLSESLRNQLATADAYLAVTAAADLASDRGKALDLSHLLSALVWRSTQSDYDNPIGMRALERGIAAELPPTSDEKETYARFFEGADASSASAPPAFDPGRLFTTRDVIAWLHAASRFRKTLEMSNHVVTDVTCDHLVACAVGAHRGELGPRFDALLERLKAKRAEIADAFYDEIADTLTDKDVTLLDAWSQQLRGRGRRTVEVARASINADLAPAIDRLNFTHEARALGLLISSPNIEPPLSIGLFGEWGTGKSYFMSLVRQSVKVENPAALQIEFNAWHYASGDVYAGIAHRIFSELHAHFSRTKDEIGKTLLRELRWAAEEQPGLQAAAGEAKRNLAEAEKERDQAVRTVETAKSSLAEKAEAVANIVAVKVDEKDLHKALDELEEVRGRPIPAADREQLSKLFDDGRATLVRLIRTDLSQHLLARVLIILFVAAGAAIIAALFTQAPVGAFLASLFAFIGGIIHGVGRASKLLNLYDDAMKRVDESVKERRAAVDTDFQRSHKKWEEALAKVDSTRKDVERSSQELSALSARLDALRPARQLEQLVNLRISEGTYSKSLGIVETLRGDFERLSLLLSARDENAIERQEVLSAMNLSEESLPELRRIVLYIDDLDRCPPEKVADVLQAVHLFLAFPLFVVVVAVDARWAAISLKQTMPQLAKGEATPEDYLEKIFQVPFWVPTMNAYGARRILSDLWPIKDGSSLTPARPELSPSPGSAAIDQGETSVSLTPPAPVDLPDASPPPVSLVSPSTAGNGGPTEESRRDDINTKERETGNSIAEYLGSSPRRLKRFANLYRLVKASMNVDAWDSFDADDAHTVICLLGLLTGAPDLAPEILDDLRAMRLVGGQLPSLATPRSPIVRQTDLERAKGLVAGRLHIGNITQEWAGRIARYSFRRDAVPYEAAARGETRP